MAIITKPVKYIAELFKLFNAKPNGQAPNNFLRNNNIYAITIQPHPASSYWLDWGGTYDTLESAFSLQVFYGLFLSPVSDIQTLLDTENSFFVDVENFTVYTNTPRAPWQYFTALTALYDNTGSTFATAPKNPANLSDNFYGVVQADVRMSVPKLNNKLNDVTSGIRVYNSFSIIIDNHDGKYDAFEIVEFFNTPIRIIKDSNGAQDILEFKQIRRGVVQDIDVDFQSMKISGVDMLYQMNKEVCRKFNITDFGVDIDEGLINDDVPVGWGAIKKVPLIKLRELAGNWIEYIALDPDYLTSVEFVYDKDGNNYGSGNWSLLANGRIRVTKTDGGNVVEAETADVTGLANCNIGNIIIQILVEKEDLQYTASVWDIAETDMYLSKCAEVGFYFDGGDTKKLIEDVLKNDLAFLIQKNSGLLSIRRWGETYTLHKIPSWAITKRPAKDYKTGADMYCSSVLVRYDFSVDTDDFGFAYLDDSKELDLFEEFRRSRVGEFLTVLKNEVDAQDFAGRLLDRFGNIREAVKIGIGYDTFEIDLLDTVELDVVLNGREFSKYSKWIVTEADPGQDVLKMEGLEI